jgi:hypothetical protein
MIRPTERELVIDLETAVSIPFSGNALTNLSSRPEYAAIIDGNASGGAYLAVGE